MMAKLEFELALLPQIIGEDTERLVHKAAAHADFIRLAMVYKVDPSDAAFQRPDLHQHVIDLAKQKLSRRKSVAFRRVWSELDRSTQFNLLQYALVRKNAR